MVQERRSHWHGQQGQQGTSETLGPMEGAGWERPWDMGSIYGFLENVNCEMEAGQCWARRLLRRQEVITERYEETALGFGGTGSQCSSGWCWTGLAAEVAISASPHSPSSHGWDYRDGHLVWFVLWESCYTGRCGLKLAAILSPRLSNARRTVVRHRKTWGRQTNFPGCGRGFVSAYLAQNSLLHLK